MKLKTPEQGFNKIVILSREQKTADYLRQAEITNEIKEVNRKIREII